MISELKNMLNDDETILYEGRPDKKCFIFESIFNPLLPFSIIWFLFDSYFLKQIMVFKGNIILMGFMIIHMMPIWIYLAGVIFSYIKYRNTYYIVSDHAIYISSGIFTMNLNTKSFQELSRVDMHRGIFDLIFDVGDVIITTNQIGAQNRFVVLKIASIKDYQKIYKLIKELQKDIYADTHFPNDYRPKENHGYKTKYKGDTNN